MSTADQEVRVARAYLSRVAEPPAPALAAFVTQAGPVLAARLVRDGEVPAEVAKETDARRLVYQPEQDLASAAAVGARLVVPEDEEWPAWPLAAFDLATARGLVAPLALWVRGAAPLADLVERAVAVVGARAATAYGETMAAEIGHGLASRGITVVSGAAYGIDGAAHRGALAAEGATVAALACGIDLCYPAGHTRLLDQIARSGAVVTEYPPGAVAARHRFLVRNRLIAGLTEGTVVVEAGIRSGSRNTAATARALGRIVMAVPGPATSAMSVGCHALIREEAALLVSRVEEVVESVGRFGLDLVDEAEGTHRPTDNLDPEALRVHEALPHRGGRSAEEVAVESGLPLNRVRALLPTLELSGHAERCDEGWRCARRRREPSTPSSPNAAPAATRAPPRTPD
ncbi:DNA processing protein [Streptoalloteichus tenebrarius]|uniref:DNA processing protein n=1 Tax=Streptoalloteichus tenebrarius (strain ATCC 17920 / DSM 40477 / JCM 4838 / CBS 697.72 / NBRC 16177 / NCIMB 11028 / NRRL B-12390 / A12253. 1 / ISP 5477) TaxID=1933 RepID=A0ABT1HZ78_STRSD|nr:DNA-processing protein DprA [Streptoalloteichus tenebrarius]MCP2260799.1 DNA processing protein [Streptoalloteichus tenebrarius]BFF03385.1 DNA-processing protein DprA [Streptoalloteichus tenebrarius]